MDERNRYAHESEIEFARLLLQCHSDEQNDKYSIWSKVFPWLYGDTVEAIAAKSLDL